MLSPTDQSHFRKYLATLGVAIIVGSLGLGGYFLQSQSDLLVGQNTIKTLSPIAQEALHRKQQLILDVATYGPVMILLLLILGVMVAVAGLRGWNVRQKVTDRKEDLEVNKLSVEVTNLTKGERDDRLDEEARTLLADEIVDSLHTGGAEQRSANDGAKQAVEESSSKGSHSNGVAGVEPEQDGNSTQVPSLNLDIRQYRVADIKSEISHAQDSVASALACAYGASSIRENLLMRVANKPRVEIDILVESPDRLAEVLVVEVKYIREGSFVRRTVSTGLAQAIASSNVFASGTNHVAWPVVFLLLDNDLSDQIVEKKTRAVVDILDELMGSFSPAPVVFVCPEGYLGSLEGSEIRQIIATGIKRRGRVFFPGRSV